MKTDPLRKRLTRPELLGVVTYDPDTGLMRRIMRVCPKTGNSVPIDRLVTNRNNRGYYWISIHRTMYLVHRLAFLYMTGEHPNGEVDHINGDRSDNRWVNLRDCDCAANSRNQGVRKDSTSGVRGVTFSSSAGKWVARISDNGVRKSLGYHTTFESAVLARRKAEAELGYHDNHGRRESWKV